MTSAANSLTPVQPETEGLHHWAVLRTSNEPDTRPFDYLADF